MKRAAAQSESVIEWGAAAALPAPRAALHMK
jgi:hypothetical protein